MKTSNRTNSATPALDLYEDAGHLIRRAHQIAVAMFFEKLGRDVTPMQYAVLRMLHECPGLDQVSLAERIALDTSTTADLAVRLELRGLIDREVLPRRQRRLVLTHRGEDLLTELTPAMTELRAGLLDGMGEDDARDLVRLLRKFVKLNTGQSSAPIDKVTPATASGTTLENV